MVAVHADVGISRRQIHSNVTLFVDGKTKFQFSMHTKKEYIKLATLQAERALKILATHNNSHCALTKCETKVKLSNTWTRNAEMPKCDVFVSEAVKQARNRDSYCSLNFKMNIQCVDLSTPNRTISEARKKCWCTFAVHMYSEHAAHRIERTCTNQAAGRAHASICTDVCILHIGILIAEKLRDWCNQKQQAQRWRQLDAGDTTKLLGVNWVIGIKDRMSWRSAWIWKPRQKQIHNGKF